MTLVCCYYNKDIFWLLKLLYWGVFKGENLKRKCGCCANSVIVLENQVSEEIPSFHQRFPNSKLLRRVNIILCYQV